MKSFVLESTRMRMTLGRTFPRASRVRHFGLSLPPATREWSNCAMFRIVSCRNYTAWVPKRFGLSVKLSRLMAAGPHHRLQVTGDARELNDVTGWTLASAAAGN